MAFDDKDAGRVVFPTRFGAPQGSQREREMLNVVGGAGGIRKKTTENPDGSTTRMVTRAGQPRFITSGGGAEVAPCLRGPFEEETTPDQFAKRRWHAPLPDMVSSDGLFRMPRAPLRKIAVMAGEEASGPRKLVEMHFASPSINAQLTEPDAAAIPILESAYGDRLWHPRQMGRVAGVGLYFCMSRLRMLSLTCKKTNGLTPFKWWFSKEDDPDTSGALPVCMNRNALETGLGTRLLHGLSQIKQFGLQVKTRVGSFVTAPPGGLLGGLDSTPVSGEAEFPAIVNENAQALNNLSTAHSCGQPWHGWLTKLGVETRTDLVNFQLGRTVKPSGYVEPESGDTFYFAIPGLPDVSEAVTDTFAYDGMSYLKDVVFFSHTKRYSPLGDGFELGPARWLHYNPDNGKVSVLRLEVVGTPSVSGATIRIHNDGHLTVRGIIGPSVLIREVSISSNTNAISQFQWAGYPVYCRVSSQSFSASYSVGVAVPQLFRFALNASTSGDRAVICHHFLTTTPFGTSDPMIASAWEVTLPGDLLAATIEQVWELSVDVPYPENDPLVVDPHYSATRYVAEYQFTMLTHAGLTGWVMEDAYEPGYWALIPEYSVRDHYAVSLRGYTHYGSTEVPSRRRLLMASYPAGGDLVLTEIETSRTYYDWPEDFDRPSPEWGTWFTASYAGSYGVVTGRPSDQGGRILATNVAEATLKFTRYARLINPDYELSSASWEDTHNNTDAWRQFIALNTWRTASNNVTVMAHTFRPELAIFAGPDVVVDGAALGYAPVTTDAYNPWQFGQASYNPRTKEIRWDSYRLGCV